VGSLDLTAVHSVRQRVEIVLEEDKRNRLVEFLTQEMEGDDKAIVFVGRKCTVDNISSDFALSDIRCQSIHGGREQYDREQVHNIAGNISFSGNSVSGTNQALASNCVYSLL